MYDQIDNPEPGVGAEDLLDAPEGDADPADSSAADDARAAPQHAGGHGGGTHRVTGRPMPSINGPPWIVRAMVESGFIVLSILLALGVDQWRDKRNHAQLARQSLQIFAREIKQNLARLDDVVPYHSGLRDVVAQMASDPANASNVQSMRDGLEGTVLLNTAWQTSLATGALTYIDVETVSALSLTYSLQDRFQDENRAALSRLGTGATSSREESLRQMQETLRYLNGLVKSEEELRGVFKQALETIAPKLAGGKPLPDSTAESTQDSAPTSTPTSSTTTTAH